MKLIDDPNYLVEELEKDFGCSLILIGCLNNFIDIFSCAVLIKDHNGPFFILIGLKPNHLLINLKSFFVNLVQINDP